MIQPSSRDRSFEREFDLPTYFAMARGQTTGHENAGDDASGSDHAGVHAMEMTKWFDTNCHYIVPEFYEGQKFSVGTSKAIEEFQEALSFGIKTKPVLLGPLTFLKLGKIHGKDFDRYRLLPDLTKVYLEVLRHLAEAQS
jgi:5-methyltetrahydropteroyltriglutamate--homocysteine methyltransferase